MKIIAITLLFASVAFSQGGSPRLIGGPEHSIQSKQHGSHYGDEDFGYFPADDGQGAYAFTKSLIVGDRFDYGFGFVAGGTENSLVIYGHVDVPNSQYAAPLLGMAGVALPPTFDKYFARGTNETRTAVVQGDYLFSEYQHARSAAATDNRIISVIDDVCGTVSPNIIPTRRTFTFEDTDGSDNDLLVLNGCGQTVTIGQPNKPVTVLGKPILGALHTPASSSEACTAGEFHWDASFMYICTSTNTYKRSALGSF